MMAISLSQKWLLILGVSMAFVSVAAGAFGAHALKQKLSQEMLAVFDIGARYQMYHALAILSAVGISLIVPGALTSVAGWLFFGGILLFSGSLYALSLTEIKILGAITPLGGLLFLAGWISLAIALIRSI